MKTIHYHFAFFLLLMFAVGCGGNVSVTGKVTFPDGSPLTYGEVLFETSTTLARGTIQSDGTYSLSAGEERGIPRGTYQVYIGGFSPTVTAPQIGPDGRPIGGAQVIRPVIPVHRDFLHSSTSNLTANVQGRTVFDITVRPPE